MALPPGCNLCTQGRINHSGAPYQRKAGALFSYAKPRFSYLWRCTFFPKKLTFLVVVTFKHTLNVRTSKQRGKNLAADRRGPLATGAPSHGTTGTMDNPALCVRPVEQPNRKWSQINYRCVKLVVVVADSLTIKISRKQFINLLLRSQIVGNCIQVWPGIVIIRPQVCRKAFRFTDDFLLGRGFGLIFNTIRLWAVRVSKRSKISDILNPKNNPWMAMMVLIWYSSPHALLSTVRK